MSAIHWLDDIDGDFGVAADWSGGVVPGASDGAVLDAAGSSFTVTSDVSEKVKSLTLAANATLDITGRTFTSRTGTGAGANAGSIMVGAGASFDVGGTLDNTGGITLQGSGQASADLLLTSNTTLSGGGTLTLGLGQNMIDAAARVRAVTLTNVDNTISGDGLVGVSNSSAQSLSIVNQSDGVIDAGGNPGYGLIFGVRPTGAVTSTIVNDGLMEANYGTSIQFFHADVAGVGGVLSVAGESSGHVTYISFDYCTVVGQTFATSPFCEIFTDASSLTSGGNIQNGGAVELFSSALTLDENTTLSGGGYFGIGMGSAVSGTASSVVLTNVDNKIILGGALGGGKLALVNEAAGTINVNGGKVVIDTRANTIVNAGLIEITGAGKRGMSVLIKSAIDNTGVIADAYAGPGSSTLTVDGAVTGAGQVTMAGGRVDFESSFNEAVTFTGATGTLVLAQSQAYTASITGFSTTGGTSLDLKDIGFVSPGEATFSGTSSSGVLTVTDGTHTARIALVGDYLDSTFTCAGDGFGGVLITDPPSPRSPHALICAMAAFAPRSATSGEAVHGAWHDAQPVFAAPRGNLA